MKFDIPFFYPKKLFSDEKFLFYLIKNDYIKTFKVFYNDLNIDLKNEKDVFLIKKMLNFAIKHNSNEIHKFIFREVEKVCDKIGFHYEILSYLIKKGILSNTSNVDFYKKEISYSIKFYNSPFCNYKRNLYPECKKSYPIFMKDYNFLISYLIKNLNKRNIDNIFTLHSIFYYETSFGSNNNVIQTCVKNNNPELLEYYASHKVLNKNNVYYKNNILKTALQIATEQDNFDFIEYFVQKMPNNISYYYQCDVLKIIARNESISGLKFLQKHTLLLHDSILTAYNNDYFDKCLLRFNLDNANFINLFFEILQDSYNKTFTLQSINHRFSEQQLEALSDIFFKISEESLSYNGHEKFWKIFSNKFSFDYLSNFQIEKLLQKYYKNRSIISKIKFLIEYSMKDSPKKDKAMETLNKYLNVNKVCNF